MATVLQREPDEAVLRRAGAPSRREQIISAAEELLAEDGLDGLTIRAVLKRTGLARRALYECFAGKDDLMLAVFERVLASSAERFAGMVAAAGDPLEGIRTIVLGIVLGPLDRSYADGEGEVEGRGQADGGETGGGGETGASRRSTALSREHLRLAEARPDELTQALRPLIELLTALTTRGMHSGQLLAGDPALTARLIYNLVATTTHSDLLTPGTRQDADHRRALADAIWAFCRRAIAA